ncbi:MAG TPA: hypothetical protein VFW23_14845 [Tepidisphaeraceae bacterium]|nr:hypothetical protein [Tepidisphaeraceae bacterium]
MTQNDPNETPSGQPSEPTSSDPKAKPAPPPRKRSWVRRVLYVIVALIVILVVVVLLIPTIASTAWVRSIVVNKVNANLNGHIEIASWSLGWFSPLEVSGVKVFDDQNRQVLQIPHVVSHLSFISAIFGKYDIGETTIDGLDFNAIRYADGTLNLAKLAKSQPANASSSPAAPKSSEKGSATTAKAADQNKSSLQISGELKVTNARGTIEVDSVNPDTHQEQHQLGNFSNKLLDVVLRPAPKIADGVAKVQIDQLSAGLPGLQLVINGGVDDSGGSSQLDKMTADLTYDAAKLWQLIYPSLSKADQDRYKDAKVTGSYTKRFNIGGNFKPGNGAAIAGIVASGDLMIDLFDSSGVTIQKLDIPILLKDGILSLVLPDKPAGQNYATAASFNGGTIDVGGISVDLKEMDKPTGHMRLNVPAGKKLLSNVNLNPAFAHLLGDYINNTLFANAENAAGLLDLTINNCTGFPLDNSMLEQSPSNTGAIDLMLQINQVQLGNKMLTEMSQQIGSSQLFGGQTLAVQSLQGSIPGIHVHIEHGITNEDMTMTFGQGGRPLTLNGSVVMATKQMNMTLDLPWQLLGFGKNTKQMGFLAGNGIQIPLTGTVSQPQFDASKAVQANLQKAPADVLKGLLGGQGNQQDGATSQPSNQKEKENPLNQLQDLFNQNRKKK